MLTKKGFSISFRWKWKIRSEIEFERIENDFQWNDSSLNEINDIFSIEMK